MYPTHCIIIFKDIETLRDMFTTWNRRIVVSKFSGDMSEAALKMRLLRGGHTCHAYLWNPKGKPYCIFMSDEGSNHYYAINRLCEDLSLEFAGFNIYLPEHGWEQGIHYFHGKVNETYHTVRYVYSMKENDRWVYYEQGVPREYEQTEKYKSRYKRDRLTQEMVLSYLASFDCDMTSAEVFNYSVCYYLDNIL